MFNFGLHSFMHAMWAIRQISAEFVVNIQSEEPRQISDVDKQRLHGVLEFAKTQCVNVGLQSAEHRLGRVFTDLRTRPQNSYSWVVIELGILLQAIEDDSQFERFYHYPKAKGQLVLRIPADWGDTIGAFPSAKLEIEEGVDCYALEHNTSAVFHMMRVAELGLRALARERQLSWPNKPKPIEWAEWQELIDKIEKGGRSAALSHPKGPSRDAALAFYSGACGQFHAFKDKYRNLVMNFRASYDELDALRAINQVRDFMNGLSAKVKENTRRPIRKWP
jgi:hypothetical protein